jgi:chaperonin cofactor prefoldin
LNTQPELLKKEVLISTLKEQYIDDLESENADLDSQLETLSNQVGVVREEFVKN